MKFQFPREDRDQLVRLLGKGGDEVLADLVRLARGEETFEGLPPRVARLVCVNVLCHHAEQVTGCAGSFDWARAWGGFSCDPRADWRGMARELGRISECAAELANRLSPTAAHYLAEKSVSSRGLRDNPRGRTLRDMPAPGEVEAMEARFDEIEARERDLRDLRDQLRGLSDLASAAAPKARPGAPRNPTRHALLWAVIGLCDDAGLRRATGEDAALVKVARIAFRHAEPENAAAAGDPRDMLRALKNTGELQKPPAPRDKPRGVSQAS